MERLLAAERQRPNQTYDTQDLPRLQHSDIAAGQTAARSTVDAVTTAASYRSLGDCESLAASRGRQVPISSCVRNGGGNTMCSDGSPRPAASTRAEIARIQFISTPHPCPLVAPGAPNLAVVGRKERRPFTE